MLRLGWGVAQVAISVPPPSTDIYVVPLGPVPIPKGAAETLGVVPFAVPAAPEASVQVMSPDVILPHGFRSEVLRIRRPFVQRDRLGGACRSGQGSPPRDGVVRNFRWQVYSRT